MKEMRNVASSLRDALAQLKADANSTVNEFKAEVVVGQANLAKVKSVTTELKSANKEVEQILGQSGSNFPPLEEDASTEGFDENGVRPTPGATSSAPGLDLNGMKK